MITAVHHRGKLIHECSIEGETRKEGFFPGHINGMQISRSRFLLLYTTRGWRGTDDNVSVVYQIRDGAYDGPLVHEGRLAESIRDWDPLGDGKKYVKGHVHPLCFGVPRNAMVNGKVPPQAGLFVFLWNRGARRIDPATGLMLHASEDPRLVDGSSATEWTQLRLNDKEDVFEPVQPIRVLRQKGYDQGYPFCSLDTRRMALTFTPPVRFDSKAEEWIGSSGFTDGSEIHVATMKFSYDPEKGLYQWTDTGPLSVSGLFESSVLPWKGSWIVSARVQQSFRSEFGGPVAWMMTDDPFNTISEPEYPKIPASRSPNTAFLCADGKIRLLTNDRRLSPYGHHRNPLYIWDIDPDRGFKAGEPAVVFDSVAKGLPIREESRPVVDQGKVFPHSGGINQIVAHRIRPVSINDPEKTGVVINELEKTLCGIYYGSLEFDQAHPGAWSFE